MCVCLYVCILFKCFSNEWVNLSEGARDLVAGMLTVNPVHRLSATEALKHDWITRKTHTEEHRQHLGGARAGLKEKLDNRASSPGQSGGLNVYRRVSNFVRNSTN